MEYNKEYAKKVYAGLTKRGYTADMLGDETKFVERMADEGNRKYLYDQVQKRGDAKMGSWEHFNGKMMEVAPVVEQRGEASAAVPGERAWWQTEVNAPKAEASPYPVNPVEFQTQVDQEEKAIAERLPQANAAMSQRMQRGQTMQGAFERFVAGDTYAKKGTPEYARAQSVQNRHEYAQMPSEAREKLLEQMGGKEKLSAEFAKMNGRQPQDEMELFEWRTGGTAVAPEFATEKTDVNDIAKYNGYSANEINAGIADEKAVALYTKEKLAPQLAAATEKTTEMLKERDMELQSAYYDEYRKNAGIPGYYPDDTSWGGKGRTMDKDWQMLKAAENINKETEQLVDAAVNDRKFFTGFGRTIANIDTWFPVMSGLELSALQELKDIDPEKASPAQKALMEALALRASAEASYSGDISNWYKMGEGVANMVPLWFEMAFNPLSGVGKAAAKKAISSVATAGTKSAMRKILQQGAIKGAGFVGSLAGGAGMAATTSLPKVAVNAGLNSFGQAQYDINAGDIEFGGAKAGDGYWTEFGKEFARQAIEHGIDQMGAEWLSKAIGKPLGWVGKGVSKIPGVGKGVTRTAQFLEDLGGEKYELLKNLAKDVKYDGPLDELGEEFMSALLTRPIDDDSLKEFFKKDNLLVTLGTVLVPFGVGTTLAGGFNVLSGGYKAGAKEYDKQLAANARATWSFGENQEEWKNIKYNLNNADTFVEEMQRIYNSPDYTNEQKKNALEYAVHTLRYMAATGSQINVDENTQMLNGMLRESYGWAYDNTVPEAVNGNMVVAADKALREAESAAKVALGLQSDTSIEDFVGSRSVDEVAMGDDTVAEALRAYYAEKALFEGMQDKMQDIRESEYVEADKSVDAVAHKEGDVYSGNIYRTTLSQNGEEIFITGGKVVLDSEGYIDVNQSEGLVALINGEHKAIQPGDLREKVTVESVEAQKAAKRAEIDARYKLQLNTFTYTDKADGTEHTVQLVSRGEQMARVILDGVEQDVPNNVFDEIVAETTAEASGEVKAESGEQEAENAESGDVVSPVETAQPVAQTALERVPKAENGEPVYEQADAETAWDAIMEQANDEELATQVVEGMIADKEAALKKLENSKVRKGVTVAEKIAAAQQRKAAIEQAKAELAKWQEIAAVKAKRAETASAPVEEQAAPVVEQVAPVESAPVVEEAQPTAEAQPVEVVAEQPIEQVAEVAPVQEEIGSLEIPNNQEPLSPADSSPKTEEQLTAPVEVKAEGGNAPGQSGVRLYSQEELAKVKEQLGKLDATTAPAFANRLFSISGWNTLEEANNALKELLASYGETLNGETAAVLPFLDEAQKLIADYKATVKEPTFTEEVLENGDKRITNYNSRGEVETVATERNGKVVSVDSYDEGVLFETTTYDENGVATSVTRYDKSGNVVSAQVFENSGVEKNRSGKVNTHSVIKSEYEKKALRERAAKWAKKLGVKVHVLESYDEVTDEQALKQILEGRTSGWFAGGEVYLYMPHLVDDVDLDRTVVHESVAHKGIRQMLGEEFGKFLDNVWNSMSVPAKAKYLSYVKAKKNATQADRRAAADEYVASIAEKVYKKQGMTAEEKSIWQKFVAWFKKKFNADEAKAEVLSKDVLDEKDIAKMVLASYSKLTENGNVGTEAETENGSDSRARKDNEGTRFSKKDSERRQEKKRINDIIDTATGIIYGNKEYAKKQRLKREAERKQLAKEMYSSVLKGDFNDVTLEQINKYIEDATPANPFGRRISQRLPQRMERALRARERTNAVDALFSRISESAVPANERFSEAGRREIEERKKELLKGWAIATGNWHTDLKEFTDDTEPIGKGQDSKVYSAKEGPYVIKASKGKPYGKRFRPDIDNIALFNDVFRNSRYEILGYGEIDGEFVRILKQRAVDFSNSVPLTSEERREYMQSLGFEPLNGANTAFSNGEIVIADLQKSNIVKDAEGNIRVIDADAKLHTKDVGGDYTYPPVESDLPEGATLDESQEARFRKVTPEMDAEYMSAVENGDMETAERLVKEAAKMAMPDLRENNTMHSVDVTPEMKESVMEGQTMFRFIGTQGAANLDKAEEATTRLDNLNVAREDQIFLEKYLGESASEEYADELITKMRDNAELHVPRLLTEEVWKNEIEGKTFQSPVGPVKIGENQFDKNKGKGREKEFGMIIPTLERPDLIFEEFDTEDGAERQTKYVFAKAFYDSEGNKHVYYADVSVLKNGMEAVTSSHHLRPNQLRKKIKEEHLLWNRFASDSSSSAQGSSTDQNNAPSADKGSTSSAEMQEERTLFRKAEQMGEDEVVLTENAVAALGEKLNIPARVVNDVESLPENKRNKKGWVENGEVVVVLPNHVSMEDAMQTVLHEVVGRKGLRAVMGEEFDTLLDNVYRNLPKGVKSRINYVVMTKFVTPRQATEEYIAGIAGKNSQDAVLNDIMQRMRDYFRGAMNLEVEDGELRYMLWKNNQRLQTPDVLSMVQDFVMETETNTGDNGIRFRTANDTAKDAYEKNVRGWRNKFKEGHYDRLRSVRKAQEAIAAETGMPISDSEDVYSYAEHLPSINKIMKEQFDNKFLTPFIKLLKRIYDIEFNGKKLDEKSVERYTNAKHGLERNRDMAVANALTTVEEVDGKKKPVFNKGAYEDWQTKKAAILAENITWEEKQDKLDALAKTYGAKLKDYSGLTAIFDPEGKMKYKQLRDEAIKYVTEMEGAVGKKSIDELWKIVKGMTDFSLKQSYESGLLSKDMYESISKRYEFYVPLRGFTEETAEDYYDYLAADHTPLNSVIKRAEGRKSEADNIFATILNMANSAIVFGNKNRLKQRVLNLATRHKSSLLSVDRAWYEKRGEDVWELALPVTNEKMTEEQLAKVYADFEADMKRKEALGEARRQVEGLNLKTRVISDHNKAQHAIRVKRNGREYIVWVNASPTMANAVNGMLREEETGWVLDKIDTINKFRSKMVTQFSPTFVLTNLFRDVQSASTVYGIRHGAKALGEFEKNVMGNSVKMVGLYLKFKEGRLDESKPLERYFKEFLENGGETGYTEMISIEEYNKALNKLTEKLNIKNATGRALEAAGEGIEFANRCVENLCRFSAYMTSREGGMSILQSINDAKEVSVNFNRKGSGGMGAGVAKRLFMFYNPAVQALAQRYLLAKKYPKRMIPLLAGEFALGAMQPILFATISALASSAFGDDDETWEEKFNRAMGRYYNLTDYRRRGSICLPLGNGVFNPPLAHESRVFFGLGELAAAMYNGHETYDNIPAQVMDIIGQSLPLNPVEGWAQTGNLTETLALNLTPDAFKPIVENLKNRDFAGNKIHNASDMNAYLPEYMRGKKSTAEIYNKISKLLSGGESGFERGILDENAAWLVNPSKLEHLVEGYLGGAYTFAEKLVRSASWAMGNEENADVRNIPFVSSFYTPIGKYEEIPSAERTRRDWERAFDYYQGEMKLLDGKEKAAKRGLKFDMENAAETLEAMQGGEALMVDVFNDGNKILKELYADVDAARTAKDFDKVKEIDQEIYAQKRFITERMEQMVENPAIGYTFKTNKSEEAYGERETYGDVRDMNVINEFQKTLEPLFEAYREELKTLNEDERNALFQKNEKMVRLYNLLKRKEQVISNNKKWMENNPEKADEYMSNIRRLRAEAIDLINKYNE